MKHILVTWCVIISNIIDYNFKKLIISQIFYYYLCTIFSWISSLLCEKFSLYLFFSFLFFFFFFSLFLEVCIELEFDKTHGMMWRFRRFGVKNFKGGFVEWMRGGQGKNWSYLQCKLSERNKEPLDQVSNLFQPSILLSYFSSFNFLPLKSNF